MFFFGLPAILVAVYGWNFRILQTINEFLKSTQQGKLVRNSFEKCSRGISYSSQIVFFQSLHCTCFSRAIQQISLWLALFVGSEHDVSTRHLHVVGGITSSFVGLARVERCRHSSNL